MQKNSNIKISIIVAAYNVEKYISDCLDSICKQIKDGIEVIVVDDGSNDGTGAICDKYLSNAHVIVIHQENGGVSVARNTGVAAAQGDWIVYVDGDDMLTDQAIDIMLSYIDHESELIVFGVRTFTERTGKMMAVACVDKPMLLDSPEDLQWYKQNVINRNVETQGKPNLTNVESITVWGKMIKRSFLQDNNILFDKRLRKGQDHAYTFDYVHYISSIEIVPDCVYLYRKNENSITVKWVKDIIYRQNLIMSCIEEMMHQFHDDQNKDMLAPWHRLAYICIYTCIDQGAYHKECDWDAKKRREWLNELFSCSWAHDAIKFYAGEKKMLRTLINQAILSKQWWMVDLYYMQRRKFRNTY